jgi:hypothetical protein
LALMALIDRQFLETPYWGDAIERAEIYDKLSQLDPRGRTVLKPADFLGFVPP